MADAVCHRGPDDSGQWCDEEHGLVFSFRRLSILDLSEHGHQPMISASGRYVIIFNGEVYNYQSIRKELEEADASPQFRGHSDTEVMLAAIETWGVIDAVHRFNGMFAFALWDRQKKLLYLARDRAGVKPLYYGVVGRTFLFGSELKALRAHPDFDSSVDRQALSLYTRLMYVPAPRTIYQTIRKLEPGMIAIVAASDLSIVTKRYWSAAEMMITAKAKPFEGDEVEAMRRLDALLHDSIRLRMIADVPLGVFLSGGIDSSIVTAIMQSESSEPVKSFTIGFREQAFNEAHDAHRVASHLGTDHHEFYVTADEALETILRMPQTFDEPFADSSQIPTYLVSRFARHNVKVCLSGDGGDELFGGYARHFIGPRIWRAFQSFPNQLRAPAARLLATGTEMLRQIPNSVLRSLLPSSFRAEPLRTRAGKLPQLLRAKTPEEFYARLLSQRDQDVDLVLGEFNILPDFPSVDFRRLDGEEWLMLLDFASYLPDDLLVKVDRASMAVSLEAREPMLDYRLVEFAWSLPLSMRLNRNESKFLLRRVLHQYIPKELVNRPKMGFAIPLGQWLRGPLRSWADGLLDADMLQGDGFFSPGVVLRRWQEHLNGHHGAEHELWAILMFQAWLHGIGAKPSCDQDVSTMQIQKSPVAFARL